MSLKGQVALVTGGGSGIGRGAALALAQDGARVVVADRHVERAQATAQQIAANHGEATVIHVDVGQSASADALVEQTLAAYGRIDVLVHCAGTTAGSHVLDMSDEEWNHVVGVNLGGTFYVTRAVARSMVERGSGTMVLIASDRGIYGRAGLSHYSASKGGVIAYMKSLALELGPRGITVNAINPGTTDTPMGRGGRTDDEWQKLSATDPLGKLSRPEDIAEIIRFLATTGGRFMTGQLITTRMRFG